LILLRRLLALEHITRVYNARRIDRDISFVNVTNDAFFIDQERGAVSEALLLIEDAVVFDDSALEVAENRKRNLNLFCEFAVGGNAVYTETENLSVG